jgi:hypothetical protein
LLIQVEQDKDLELTGLADENFIEAASKWSTNEQAEAAQRSSDFSKELDG